MLARFYIIMYVHVSLLSDISLSIVLTILFYFAGDYFIAELVESQDSDHKTIVAEVNA